MKSCNHEAKLYQSYTWSASPVTIYNKQRMSTLFDPSAHLYSSHWGPKSAYSYSVQTVSPINPLLDSIQVKALSVRLGFIGQHGVTKHGV